MNTNNTSVFPIISFSIKKENIDKFATQSQSTVPNKHTDSLEANQSVIKTEHDFVIDSDPCSKRKNSGSNSKKRGSKLLNYLFSKSLSEQEETKAKNKDVNLMGEIDTANFAFGNCKLETEVIQIMNEENGVRFSKPRSEQHQETKAKNKDVNLISEIDTVNKTVFGYCKLKTEEIHRKDEENVISMASHHHQISRETNKKNKPKAIHKCIHCSYTTDNKSHFKGHALCHPKLNEVVMHKCDNCDFQTNYKKNLKRHIIVKHTTFDEVSTFKCDECEYQTPYKTYIKEHLLKHTNPAETDSYQCAYCDYKSIYRRNLNRHLIKHKDPKDVKFKCDLCSFRTYEARTLKSHYLRHTRLEAIKMHECDMCDFKSVSGHGLNLHVYKRHLDQLKPFKCEECGVRAIDESALAKHSLRQHKNKETKMFKCDQCTFQTLYKHCLTVHFNKHKNAGEING